MWALLRNTDEEDAAITAAAMSDPDARPLTDAEWEAVKPRLRIGVLSDRDALLRRNWRPARTYVELGYAGIPR